MTPPDAIRLVAGILFLTTAAAAAVRFGRRRERAVAALVAACCAAGVWLVVDPPLRRPARAVVILDRGGADPADLDRLAARLAEVGAREAATLVVAAGDGSSPAPAA